MRLYAFLFSKYGGTKTQQELAKMTGIAPETVSRWKQNEHFCSWFDQVVAEYRRPIHDRLEFIALEKLEDPRFWKFMAEKHGYLKPKKK